MKKLIVHVGLPKTATTTLQRKLFWVLHKKGLINFLGRMNTREDESYFNPLGEVIYSDKDKVCEIKKLLSSSKVNLYSEECLSLNIDHHDYSWMEIIKNSAVDYDVEILITLRNPYEFFLSYYAEMYHWHYQYDAEMNSINKFATKFIEDPNRQDFFIFKYDKYIERLKLNFNKVHVVFFEDIESGKLIKDLEEVINVDIGDIEVFKFNENSRVKVNKGCYSEATRMDTWLFNVLYRKYRCVFNKATTKGNIANMVYRVVQQVLKRFYWRGKLHENLSKDVKNKVLENLKIDISKFDESAKKSLIKHKYLVK